MKLIYLIFASLLVEQIYGQTLCSYETNYEYSGFGSDIASITGVYSIDQCCTLCNFFSLVYLCEINLWFLFLINFYKISRQPIRKLPGVDIRSVQLKVYTKKFHRIQNTQPIRKWKENKK